MAAVIFFGLQFVKDTINLVNSALLLSPKQLINIILEIAVFYFVRACLFRMCIVAPESNNANFGMLSTEMFIDCKSLILSG